MTDQPPFDFDGSTIHEDPDAPVRLTGLMLRVTKAMRSGEWLTLNELAFQAGGSEASVSARLRDLRKTRWGSHTVERRLLEKGLYQYRVLWADQQQQQVAS